MILKPFAFTLILQYFYKQMLQSVIYTFRESTKAFSIQQSSPKKKPYWFNTMLNGSVKFYTKRKDVWLLKETVRENVMLLK